MGSSSVLELTRLLALVAVTALGSYHPAAGGCSGRCCRGRDLSCTATDWRMDRVYGLCYCDAGCARTKDCCFDYFTECPAQDCSVSAWSHWSGCSSPCRPAVRVRVRRAERQAGNSGAACPPLEERAGCRDYRGKDGEPCGETTGPAFITSLEFGKGRPEQDVHGAPLDRGFCMEFTLESRTSQCAVESRPNTYWMRYISQGFKVCVACQPPAMHNGTGSCQGDGQDSDREALLRWQALGNPRCSGTWRKVQRTQHCSCPPQHSFLFI